MNLGWLAGLVLLAAPDAGVVKVHRLSDSQCEALVDHLATLAVREQMASHDEVKPLSVEEKRVTERLAREALAKDPQLKQVKRECQSKYLPGQWGCLMAASTMREADLCTREVR